MPCGTRQIILLFRIVTAFVIALSLFLFQEGCKAKTPPPPPPPKAAVARPVKQEVTDWLEITGTTQAVNTVQLVARVAGNLDKVFFRDGQMVRKGQPLFLIQRNTYEHALRQAEGQVLAQQAQLEYAQSQLVRNSNLLSRKAAAQSDVDNWKFQRDSARANLKTAEANRDLAKLNLGYTLVTAPFSGRIDRRLQDPGNLVGSGGNTLLAQLSQIDPIYVYFTISDSDLSRLMKNMGGLPGQPGVKSRRVFIGLFGEEAYPHEGRLDFAATSLSSTSGTLLMRGVFPNPSGGILPGLYARARVQLDRKMAILLPETAVSSDQQGSYVLIVDSGNTVLRRNVKTGLLSGNMRVIEDGLNGREQVIVRGLLKARPGSRVTPETEQQQQQATAPSSPAKSEVRP